MVRLEVKDFGVGFSTTDQTLAAGPGQRIGLVGMQERATLVGGRCTIVSQPGQGTSVQVEIPLPPAIPERAPMEQQHD